MKDCPRCGARSSDDARFCRGCGGAFPTRATETPWRVVIGGGTPAADTPDWRRCPSCDAELGALARFCPSCGRAREAPREP